MENLDQQPEQVIFQHQQSAIVLDDNKDAGGVVVDQGHLVDASLCQSVSPIIN